MKTFTLFTSALLACAVLLSSCQAPGSEPFDRPPPGLKYQSGGFNPGSHDKRNRH